MNSAAFIDAQGRGKHSWPRTLGTLGLMVAAAAAIIIPLRAVVLPWLSANADDMPEPVRSGILALSAGLIFGRESLPPTHRSAGCMRVAHALC